MKHLKMIGFAAFAAMALMAIGASTASATTLEIKGVKQTGAVEMSTTLQSGTSMLIQKTDGSFANTCSEAVLTGKTSIFTGTAVSEPLSTLSFTSCTSGPFVTDIAGSLSIENISGTTNGTVKSIGAEVTMPSPFGTLNCKTGAGTDIGTLTGQASGQATLDLKAIINCGILASSMSWVGSYRVTSPEGLGIVA